ncbi:MAG: polysaccharide biosynthesis protein [Lewinellaceae bacterium]|nr:polysaccharide biosynthesis protein [Lewinellaceae bacterium]
MLDLPKFISQHVTGRSEPLFKPDLERFNAELAASIDGRSVLVIGGAGTIGASFVKAILKFRPARLYVIDINENGLTELVRDLRSSLGFNIPPVFLTYPIDFGDAVFEKILRREGPFEIVANFAAHKHVRSEKDHYSIEAMLINNVFKAKHLLDLLAANKPERFFCVSTDKAAKPVNVMGASKKLMEQMLLSYASEIPVTTARFANVSFSNGSLLAGFLERLMKRQPLSAPKDVQRYFLSPEESGQLCLLACVLGKSGEVFFPKLDARHDLRRFSDIGTALLETLGFQADICGSEQEAREKAALITADSKFWPVFYFASDTSGEKAREEFFTEKETLDLERFAALGVVKPSAQHSDGVTLSHPVTISQMLLELKAVLAEEDVNKDDLVTVLQRLVPDFQHIETGKGLDSKM